LHINTDGRIGSIVIASVIEVILAQVIEGFYVAVKSLNGLGVIQIEDVAAP